MPTSATGISSKSPQLPMRRQVSGFTLLEILVVVIIIGIVVSMAMISINVLGRDRQMDEEARRLQAVLSQAREDAMLEGRDVGLRLDVRGYDFVRYDARQDRWDTVPGDPLLRERAWPDGLEAELWMESRLIQLQSRSTPAADSAGPAPPAVAPTGDAAKSDKDDKDDKDAIDALRPQVVVQASGELVPFEIRLKRAGTEEQRVVTGIADGGIEVKDPNADKQR